MRKRYFHMAARSCSESTNIYYIWYGNWAGNSHPQFLETFGNSSAAPPDFSINTTYH
jgi:hypothetical protein